MKISKAFLSALFMMSTLVTVTGGMAQDSLIVDASLPNDSEFYDNEQGDRYTGVEWNLRFTEICSWNTSIEADETGDYLPWFELHNYGEQPIALDGLYVTDDLSQPNKWLFNSQNSLYGNGQTEMDSNSYNRLWVGVVANSSFHTNFSLKRTGGILAIYSPNLKLIDMIEYPALLENQSYGWHQQSGQFNFFEIGSPGRKNSTEALMEVVPLPIPSVAGGFYNESQSITLASSLEGTSIYYTLDGSTPNESAQLYNEAITLEENTTIRAIAVKEGYINSLSTTHSYFFGMDSTFPIISLVMENSDWEGPNGINEIDNRYDGIEKPVHLEFFETDGSRVIGQNIGIKIHAPDNRPQQSLRLYARSEYGVSKMIHQVFPDKEIYAFKRLVLRNGGNDGSQTGGIHFRDPLVHELFKRQRSDNAYAAYRPAHVYLNGQYWGIYNIRERQDKHYMKSNFGVSNIDLLERTAQVSGNKYAWEGDWTAYDAFEDYLYENDMSQWEHEEYLLSELDVDNAIDYYLTEIYTGNRDWLTNNIKFWKEKQGGKWRWLLWDTEYGMGRYPNADHGEPQFNSLRMSLLWGGWDLSHANYGKNTRFSRHLLGFEGRETETIYVEAAEASPLYKQKFISRAADLLNMYHRESYVSDRIDEFKEMLAPEIELQLNQWGGSLSDWEERIEDLRAYTQQRPYHLRQNILSQLEIDTDYLLSLQTQPIAGGTIKVNTIHPKDFPWDGYYFSQVPVSITAWPQPGYQFVSWNNGAITTPTHTFTAADPQSYTAYFEAIPNELGIVINEINYNSHPNFDTGDWIELYNPNANAIDISGWTFKDSDDMHIYTFAEGSEMLPGAFLVLCNDQAQFGNFYPEVTSFVGNFDFGLSSTGEQIRLYDADGSLIDALTYGVDGAWSSYPNGNGPTLELIQPTWNNSLSTSWRASYNAHGTPGAVNSDVSQQLELMEYEQENYQEYASYPNPFQESTSFRFDMEGQGIMELEIYDMSGQQVHKQEEYYAAAGTYVVKWTPLGLKSGLYFYRLKTRRHLIVNKLLYLP
jgi:hypothetical protein